VPVELAIGVIEDFAARDSQYLSGGKKLGAAHMGKLFAAGRIASIGGRLALGEADYSRLYASGVGHEQRASKGTGFIVGMRGDAHESIGQVNVSRKKIVSCQWSVLSGQS
jgi:hypothetical protein